VKILDSNKKHHFKTKKYSLNEHDIVCRTEKAIDITTKKKTGPNVTLPIVWIEVMFEKIYSVHSLMRGHQGIRKTLDSMDSKSYGCTETIVTEFRRRCQI